MDFLHYEFDAGSNDVVEVTLDHAANVQLMDESSFVDYRNGRSFRYFGGYVKSSPFKLSIPHSGRWHLVIDLGGAAGTVRASMRILNQVAA